MSRVTAEMSDPCRSLERNMLIQIGLQGSIEEAYLRRDECSRVSSQRLRTLVRMQDDSLRDLQAANVNNTMFIYRTDSKEIDRTI